MRAKSPQQQGCFNASNSEARKRAGHAKNENQGHMLDKSRAHTSTPFCCLGTVKEDLTISLHARMLKCS